MAFIGISIFKRIQSSLFLESQLPLDDGSEALVRLVSQYRHEIALHGFLESKLILNWVQDSRSFASSEDMSFDFGFEGLLEREVLNVIDDSHPDELCLVVDPDKEGVVDSPMSTQEAGVVVDGDLHQSVHCVIHANRAGVMVFKEVGVELGHSCFALGLDIPS